MCSTDPLMFLAVAESCHRFCLFGALGTVMQSWKWRHGHRSDVRIMYLFAYLGGDKLLHSDWPILSHAERNEANTLT